MHVGTCEVTQGKTQALTLWRGGTGLSLRLGQWGGTAKPCGVPCGPEAATR